MESLLKEMISKAEEKLSNLQENELRLWVLHMGITPEILAESSVLEYKLNKTAWNDYRSNAIIVDFRYRDKSQFQILERRSEAGGSWHVNRYWQNTDSPKTRI